MFLYICRELKTLSTMPKYIILSILMFFGLTPQANAQFGFSHEVGVIVGPVAFQSDFGERHNMETNLGNTGYGIGLIHYLNFAYSAECNCYAPLTYFNDHFKLRSELSYNKTKLDHFGQWVDGDGALATRLRGMKGSTSITNIGMQLEYFPLSIRDFSATPGAWGPFVSLGAQFSFYNPEVYSTLGPMGIPATTPIKYYDAYTSENGTVWSVVGSIGTRYKLTILSDLMIDLRWQYYFSDWVDGLRPDPTIYKENKANDWNVWLNVGYIYYID
jgi:hypothetical protein